ncbi:MAG: HYR domain-containing protein, partial [Bacteroidetes bacterium]
RKLNTLNSLFAILIIGFMAISFSSNPPNGFTGAPPSNNTCANTQGGCHFTGNYSGTLTISGLPATIMPSTTYSITVTVVAMGNSPVQGGFQMTALDANNSPIGTWMNPGTGVGISGQFAEHNGPKSYVGGMVSWTVDWQSPASGNTTVTMYAASLMANGNFGTSGDHVVTGTASGAFMSAAPISVSITNSNNASCAGMCDGSAMAAASGGAPPYMYAWSNGQTGAMATNLCAGTYTVTATDPTGAMATASVTIGEPPALSVAVTNVLHIDCTNAVGTATAVANGGTPGYNYNWSNGQNGPTASFTQPGTYSVTVSDLNQCTAQTQVTINANLTPPVANAGPDMTIDCVNATVTLDGSASSQGPNFSYMWSGPGIVSGGNTAMPVVNAAGNYSLTVTDLNNGCTASDEVIVTANTTVPIADAGPDMSLDCVNTTATLDGSASSQGPNFSYLWTTANGNIVSGVTTLSPVVDAPGSYQLIVTDNTNGCTSEDFTTVTEDVTPPTISIDPPAQIDCNNPTVTLCATGNNVTYQWTGPCITSPTDQMCVDVDCGGSYCVVVTDLNNGCTSETCVTVEENLTIPVASAGADMALNCNTTTVTLDGTGSSQGPDFTYNWTTADGNIVSGGNTLTPVVDAPGTYLLLVVNTSNGCSNEDEAIVTQTPPPVATATVNNNVDCNGNATGSATITATNGTMPYTYLWSDGSTQATNNALTAGMHGYTVTDADGCTDTGTVSISEPPLLVASAMATDETALGANDGTASANPSGGTPPYSYAWSTGDTTATIENLAPGSYTVTVSDANNCAAVETVMVNAFVCGNITVNIAGTNVSCNGGNDGAATATVSNGTPPFSYLWSTQDTTASISGLPAGTYTVSVTDAGNCTAVGSIIISEPSALTIVSIQTIPVACHGDSTGQASLEVSGGTPDYTFQWDDPNQQTTATATNLPAGTWSVTVSDANNCSIVGQATINEPDELVLNLSSTNETSAGANDGTASANPSGGTPPYLYEWNNGATTPTIENLPPGNYCVTVIDDQGCSQSGCVDVLSVDCSTISSTITTSDETCADANDGTAAITTTGGTPPYQYIWSDNGTGAVRTDLDAGIYSVTCTDAAGCTTTLTNILIGGPPPIALSMSSTMESAPGAGDGTATADPAGGIGNFTFLWNTNDTTPTIEGLVGGFYCVTVTDDTGCTAESCVEVMVGNCGTTLIFGTTQPLCHGENTGSAFVVASGGLQPFTFEWSNGMTGDSIINLSAGTYTVTATDPASCQVSGMVEITEPDSVEALILNITQPMCVGDSTGVINGGASGGFQPYAFAWSNGSTEPTLFNVPEGTYTLTVSDNNNCSATTTVELIAPPDTIPPVLVFQSISLYLDENGEVNITPEMLDNGTFDNCELDSVYINVEKFTCADIGTNTVIFAGLDAAGNCATQDVFVNVWDTIPPKIICPDNITTTNCADPVMYDLPIVTDQCDSVTLFLASGLPSGANFPVGTTHNIYTALDGSNNAASCTFIVTVESDLAADFDLVQMPSCFSFEDGALSVKPSGGTAPYFIQWNTGQTGDTLTNLAAGNYTATIIDGGGCSTMLSIDLDQPDPIAINVDQVSPENGHNMDGAIEITATGGSNGVFQYEWFFMDTLFSTNEDISGLSSGNYIIVVTDTTGCATSDTVFVDFVSGLFVPGFVQQLDVFPNPTNREFQVALAMTETRPVRVDLLDYTGRLLRPGNTEPVRERVFRFDLSPYPSGVYGVRIIIGDTILFRRIVRTD